MYRQGNQDYVDIAKTYAFNYLMREFSMHQNSYLINSIEITPTEIRLRKKYLDPKVRYRMERH